MDGAFTVRGGPDQDGEEVGTSHTHRRGERAMETCDQRGCEARALREMWFDSGGSLWFCSHHCAQNFPWIEPDVRFSDEPCLIVI